MSKTVRHTIAEWTEIGPAAVAAGATAVKITDRSPTPADDTITPEGWWGWMYGWRWMADDEECSGWTLPEEIFLCLSPCPHPTVRRERRLGHGPMPRWPDRESAQQAMNDAAYDWAFGVSGTGRKAAEHADSE